jgi:hypothetical protein
MGTVNINARGAAGTNGQSAQLAWRSLSLAGFATQYLHAWQAVAIASASSAVSKIAVPLPAVIKNMRALSDALAVGVTYTVQINGVDTSLTCTISASNTTASDTTHSASVAAGDLITLKAVQTGTDATTAYPAAFVDYQT